MSPTRDLERDHNAGRRAAYTACCMLVLCGGCTLDFDDLISGASLATQTLDAGVDARSGADAGIGAASTSADAGDSGEGAGGEAGDASTDGKIGEADGNTIEDAGAGAANVGDAGDAATDVSDPCGAAAQGTCSNTLEGVYALKVVLDVWWHDEVNAAHLLEPGRGKIAVYFRGEISEICAASMTGVGKLHSCGLEVPPYLIGVNCTALQMQFPAALWEKSTIPEYVTTVGVTGFEPGSILSMAQTVGLLGIDLAHADSPFPTYADTSNFACTGGKTGRDCFPDQDGDGKPGVTIGFVEGIPDTLAGTPEAPYSCNALTPNWKNSLPPTQVLGGVLPTPSQSISEVYLGVGLSAAGTGSIDGSCRRAMGDATWRATLPIRIPDCRKADGKPCTAADAMFIDSNTPLYHVLQKGQAPPPEWKHPTREAEVGGSFDRSHSVGPRSEIVRLGERGTSFTCGQVRAAQFSQL